MPGGLQVEKRAVQFNQCGRQQSVVATSGPYVIRFVYSVHYLVTLVTQSFFFFVVVFLSFTAVIIWVTRALVFFPKPYRSIRP